MIQRRNPPLKQGVAFSGRRIGARGNLATLVRMIRAPIFDTDGLMID
jgi:hypothetical protein